MHGPCQGFCGFLIVDTSRFLLCVGMLHLLEVSKGFALLLLQSLPGLLWLSHNGPHDVALTVCCWRRWKDCLTIGETSQLATLLVRLMQVIRSL